MKFYSGQNGRVLLQTRAADSCASPPVTAQYKTLAKVIGWSFNSSMAALDTTTLEDTDRTYISGLRSTTGKCRIYFYDYSTGSTRQNDAKDLITKLVKARTAGDDAGVAPVPENVVLEFQIAVDANTTRKIQFEALLTSASMSMSVGEVLSADVSFQANGAPTAVAL